MGFIGLWSPSELPIAFLELARTMVVLARTTHWDGDVGGRVQMVNDNPPRCDQEHARIFLQSLDPLQATMGELLTPEPLGVYIARRPPTLSLTYKGTTCADFEIL